MLSRLALRGGQLCPLLKTDLRNGLYVTAVRNASQVENWKKAHELYNSPERDHKNFPTPRMPDSAAPVRFGFIPDSWFKFFYEKTGVTGPYVFGVGLVTTLISKELWVVEHGMMEFVAFWTAVYFLIRKFGPKVRASLEKDRELLLQTKWYGPLDKAKTGIQNAIDAYEKAIWREEGQKYVFEAKRENVALQLEEEYRRRLFESYEAVKKRLDYHVAIENTTRRFQQDHMVNWIVDNVVKGITPQQERDSITKCISDLKILAKAN